MAVVANNGVMYRPHLVHYITDSRSGEKTLIEPKPLRGTLPWKQQNIDTIKKAMIGVNKEGTGARAFAGVLPTSRRQDRYGRRWFSLKGADYKSGKLKQELRDHGLFIAFGSGRPTENRSSPSSSRTGLGRAVGRADRAHGDRLLPAGQAAQGAGEGRRDAPKRRNRPCS